jgi:hypothetical protein
LSDGLLGIRSVDGMEESDKSGVMARIVLNRAAFGKRNRFGASMHEAVKSFGSPQPLWLKGEQTVTGFVHWLDVFLEAL